MVVPTFANLVRKRLPLPYATALLCAAPVMNPMAIWSTWFAFTGSPWMVAARVGLGMLVASAVGIVVRRPPVPLPRRTGPSADEGPDAGL